MNVKMDNSDKPMTSTEFKTERYQRKKNIIKKNNIIKEKFYFPG